MKIPKNMASSVRQRLLDGARSRGEEFNLVLTRYAIERLLYRLSQSPHRDRFVLKGAALYVVWAKESKTLGYRPTRDLDLWGSGSSDVKSLLSLFQEVALTPVEDDGLLFESEAIRGQLMREDELYEGCRLSLVAMLGNVRIPLTVDFGFGDAITPPASEIDYPVLLSTLPAPRVRAYPRETVVAEKFEALVALDLTNTRMKDFYDMWTLSRAFDFDGQTLLQAVCNTFERRKTALPDEMPLALTERFGEEASKIAAWAGFARRSRLTEVPPLSDVLLHLQTFLWPLAQAARNKDSWNQKWAPQNGWQKDES